MFPCLAAGALRKLHLPNCMHWLIELGNALRMAAVMGWQMLWALIVGFALSAVVQATGQKVIVYAAILTVLIQSLHMRWHVGRNCLRDCVTNALGEVSRIGD